MNKNDLGVIMHSAAEAVIALSTACIVGRTDQKHIYTKGLHNALAVVEQCRQIIERETINSSPQGDENEET